MSPIALAVGILMVVALLFGGASRQNELRLAMVELAALPVLLLAIFSRGHEPGAAIGKLALGILIAIAAIPLIQLVPLPPALWTRLPGRDTLVTALALADVSPGWNPLSLVPDRTWRSFLALLPPVSIFVGILALPDNARLKSVHFLLAATLVFVLLGAAQIASGGDRLYPWRTTDAGNFTGFFANRNHMATLCLVALPFTSVAAGRALKRLGSESQFRLWLYGLFIVLLVVALAVIRSRAGIVLAGPVLVASAFAFWVASGKRRPGAGMLGLAFAVTAALIAVSMFALAPILDRFDSVGNAEGRFENWPLVFEAAQSYLPLGSGMGSFDAVFRSVEPLETLDSTYFNQAHNDYLETWLETGWLGIAVLVPFLLWFGRRSTSAWRGRATSSRDLQRASSIAITAILIHSAVDYPLRTTTIAVVFALCCALLELARIPDATDEGFRKRSRTGD